MTFTAGPAAWWQRGVIYQIYPRSFQDSNGDGIGDLAGITRRLGYLVWLGVDALWLSPINTSPMADFGYDVSDYTGIDPIFGAMADFDALLAAAHKLGLKVILDFVPNHTSDEHPWFVESRRGKHSPRRDWYIWRDPGLNGGPPNNWLSEFGGPAWTFDKASGQYYYHAYLPQQPDLNWRNRDVRAAMLDVLRFWLDKGVDGFRLDTIHHLFEDTAFRDNPPNPDFRDGMAPTLALKRVHQVDLPEVQEVMAEFRTLTDAYNARVLVGEAYLPLEQLVAYYGKNGEGVHLPFNFQLIGAKWNASFLADLIRDYESLLPQGAWPNWVLGNHDRSRVASRFGSEAARLAAMLLLTLRGTPTLYYGDELGVADVLIASDQVQDPWEKRVPGFGLGRDPVRTPMAWDANDNAGFTAAKPWLPLHADADTTNVMAEIIAPASMLSLHRALLELRRKEPALALGDYGLVEARGDVLVYERTAGKHLIMIALNLGAATIYTPLPRPGVVLLSSHMDRAKEPVADLVRLRGSEGLVIEISA